MGIAELNARPLERDVDLVCGAEPVSTLAPLRQGAIDPQMRLQREYVARAMRLASGPATVELRVVEARIRARAWGPGAAEALNRVPALVGELDDPRPFAARHALIAQLARRLPGLRFTSGTPIIEALVPSILGQKVTSYEAHGAHALLLRRHGERAPGPLGLWLPPPPEKLARMPYWAYHPLGIERRRAEAIRAAAASAALLEDLRRLPREAAWRRLLSLPGVGPWTAAETLRLALGDPDAVSVGDFHIPRLVCAALAGERDGDDARMLELLEPYRGQRARVVLLLENAGLRAQRRVPRPAARSIAQI